MLETRGAGRSVVLKTQQAKGGESRGLKTAVVPEGAHGSIPMGGFTKGVPLGHKGKKGVVNQREKKHTPFVAILSIHGKPDEGVHS